MTSLLLPLFAFSVAFGQSSGWEDPAIFRINKEAPRVSSMPFPERESALSKGRLESPWCQVLNGAWKFHYSGHPDARPLDFYKPEFDVSGWREIPVPSNWQLHGYGVPVFANSEYPFATEPPTVMGDPPEHFTNYRKDQRNPIGSYRRTFSVPAAWKGQPVHLVFQGVDSAFYLWINGEKVGYSEDSRTPAEFDVTRFLKEGENVVAAEVYQNSDGSYLEDPSHWKMSGIFRDVYLWTSPSLDVRDHWLQAGLNEDYTTGTIHFSASLVNEGQGASEARTKLEVFQPDGLTSLFASEATSKVAAGSSSEVEIRSSIPLSGVQGWSAETPVLYPYLITLSDGSGKPLAFYSGRTGFRRNEIKDGQFLHNGKPILFKGVNRQDHHPRTGHSVTEKDIEADLLQMKRANINAIRCAHYPNDPRFYELCDELGFYVVDEANLASHHLDKAAAASSLAADPAWGPARLDRMKSCLERDKNHPSIVMWSMGKSSGDGSHFEEISRWIKQRDPSRPVLSEQVQQGAGVDIFAPAYAPIQSCLSYCRSEERRPLAGQRPLIQVEYNHAMGNSSGNLADYWEVYRSERLLQGGFIGNWKDQGISKDIHEVDAAQDRSGSNHAASLFGSLSKDEGLYGGGVLVSKSADFNLREGVTLVVDARANHGRPQAKGESSQRDEPEGLPMISKGGDAYMLRINPAAAKIEFLVSIAGKREAIHAGLPQGWSSSFHLLAGSYDGKQLMLYIDGKLVAERPCSGPMDTNNWPVAIGLDGQNPDCKFNGSIRRAAIYGRALDAGEIGFGPDALVSYDFVKDAEKPESRQILAYGGDFNDRPNRGSFCCNGVVLSNGQPGPQFEEVRKVYQDILVEGVDLSKPDLKIRISNERFFAGLADLSASWLLLKDGVKVSEGPLPLPEIAPQASSEVSIPTGVVPEPDAEYHLQVRFHLVSKTAWLPAKVRVAWAELALPWGKRKIPVAFEGDQQIELREPEGKIMMASNSTIIGIDRRTGMLSSWRVRGREKLASPLALNFWRPPTNNDEGAWLPRQLAIWRRAGVEATATSVMTRRQGSAIVVESKVSIPAGESEATVWWTFYPSGQIAADVEFVPKGELPMIPRVGMQCGMSPIEVNSVTWFGKGPHENYVDRQTGAWTGIHSAVLAQIFHKYTDPQESGNRRDVRWARFNPVYGLDGFRVDATGDSLLSISVYPASPDILELARHPSDFSSTHRIYVNFDHSQMGVGGTNSWGELPLEKYRLAPQGVYRWSFLLTPEAPSNTPPVGAPK